MLGTPYVSRARHWCNTSKAYVPSNRIHVGETSWDGIDKRDYDIKFKLTPDEARYIATELWKMAEQIDGKTKKTSSISAIRKRTKQIAQEAKTELER